jgi:hypothetical protein
MQTKLWLALAMSGTGMFAQNVISAKSGLIHHIEGDRVTLEGKQIKPKAGEFPIMKDGETLATEDAMAEVLLTPGVFLRLGNHASFKMVSNQLSDTRVEILTGSAILEVEEIAKGNSVMLLFGDSKITPLKHGLYRMDAKENRFRVYDGEAQVIRGADTMQVKGGKQIEFSAILVASKFDRKEVDSLDIWASEQSRRIAQANFTSANAMRRGGSSSNGYLGGWVWNPYYDLFTFVPGRGYGYNPYGWVIYSPRTVVYYYGNPALSTGNNSPWQASNASIGDNRGAMSTNSAVVSSNPSVGVSAAPAATMAAPSGVGSVAHGGASAGGRGR